MRRIFLILMIVSIGWCLSAQDTLSWKQQFQRHDIQIGIGDPLIVGLQTRNIFIFDDCLLYKCNIYSILSASDWFSPDTYSSGIITTPTFSVSYKYRFAKWFWFGGTISYTGFYKSTYDRITDIKLSTYSSHYLVIMPEVRFSWLNRKIVTMYSGIGIGAGIVIDATHNTVIAYPNKVLAGNWTEAYVLPTGHVTLVGIHVGRKWYGFAEIGMGCKGILQVGFGYNFNSKKK